MSSDDSVKAGVSEAWDFWLSQHDVSVPATIHDAVKQAVAEWLNSHGEQLFAAAVADVLRIYTPTLHEEPGTS